MSSLGHSIWTVVVFIIFIGIVLWAYSGNRKKDFEEAANLALDDDDKPKTTQQKTEE
jgi:cytochrome c oxidase cbb3-type subunit IV